MLSEISCAICGKKKEYPTYKIKNGNGKYCSKQCSYIAQKGRKNPHSKEWEEKRIAAIKANSYKNKGRPNIKSKETIKKALTALSNKRKENPDYYREIALKNLPKDVSGEKNGNFRNWKTKKSNSFRIQNSSKFRNWRNLVLNKSGNKCIICGFIGKLDAHHIIALSESKKPAFELWNGVALCRTCHKDTKSFGSQTKEKHINNFDDGSNNLRIIIKVIPHSFQEYNTVGNYKTIENEMYVLVSNLDNEIYHKMVIIHELIEEALTKHKGITEQEITDFDLYYESRRKQGLVPEFSEPGFDKNAPYRDQHAFASSVEYGMCAMAGLNFMEYDHAVNEL